MKIRSGFISNSSSSSFVIQKRNLTGVQIEKIKNHAEVAKESMDLHDQPWSIQETDKVIAGSTWMDNFDMHYFLTEIGVNADRDVKWGDGYLYDDDLEGEKTENNDLVETITDRLVEYLTMKMSGFQPWERADIREIVLKEVAS